MPKKAVSEKTKMETTPKSEDTWPDEAAVTTPKQGDRKLPKKESMALRRKTHKKI